MRFVVLFSIGVILTSCKENTSTKVLTKEIVFKKEGTAVLKKVKTDSIIANLDIEIADDEYQRQTGLMYRHSMKNHQAMLFIFKDERPRSFYMKNTEISLDIIYLNKNKQIVSIQKNAKPYDETSLPSQKAAQYVLEVNSGLSDKWNLKTGDLIEFSGI